MDTVTPTKTRCEVVDQIVEWTRPDGTLTSDPRHVRYTLESSPRQSRYARVGDLVAVRRYIETEESSHDRT